MINLSDYDNSNYEHGGLAKRIVWMIFSVCFFETWFPWPSSFKCMLLRIFNASVGQSVVIKPNVKIKYPWNLKIGNYCWIGEFVWIDNLACVDIACNVCISQGAYILTGNHDYQSKRFTLLVKPIKIEQGCWVGAKVVLCPGVILKYGSIATVGSVVTSNLESMSIYQGNPAVKKKEWSISQ
ncbi:WcaF family extracellular polysaccharide biosynthesis acetyltransferase [Aeromonas veronii]